jgi:hypothetical protein
VGDHVFLKVKAKKSSLKLGSFSKLALCYYGPFDILERIVPIAYMLAFPISMHVNNVFYMSFLKKYVPHPKHVIDWTMIQVEHEDVFYVQLVCILDRKIKCSKNRAINLVNVQWTCYIPIMLQRNEDAMREQYPQLFE